MKRRLQLVVAALAITLSGCLPEETPSPSQPATASPTPPPTVQPSPAPTSTVGSSGTPTPEPSLSLELPEATDPRVVSVEVAPEVSTDGGTLTVTVTSAADERIDEIVLRWPAELNEILFVAPFTPSDERIREGGDPLVQPWTKWVVGPGEQGEPEGTISVGWGPLLPGATLTIPLDVTRRAAGPVAFDLQLLAGNDLLSLGDRQPAELRVEVP